MAKNTHGSVPDGKAPAVQPLPLARLPFAADEAVMWDQPYLETCCRSALHRLSLAGAVGRPPALKDGPCLERLAREGLTRLRPDGNFELTDCGVARHAAEILGAGDK